MEAKLARVNSLASFRFEGSKFEKHNVFEQLSGTFVLLETYLKTETTA
jgi:hypothetical protein